MFKRIFERRVFIAAMLAVMALFAGWEDDDGVRAMPRITGGEPLALHQQIAAEQRHFDIYRNYRAAFDVAAPVIGDGATGADPCYERGAFSD